MEISKVVQMVSTYIFILALIAIHAHTEKLLSKRETKQRLVQLIGNSVAINLTTELKTNGAVNFIDIQPWKVVEVFFEVRQQGLPITIYVDPMCFASLQWKVSFLEIGNLGNVWKRVEINTKQKRKGPKSFLRVRNSHGNSMSVALATYDTKDSQHFVLHSAPSGFYKIEMHSFMKEMQVVKVSVLAGSIMDVQVPFLPPDNQISFAHINESFFNLYWKPAQLNEGAVRMDARVQYCVSVNTKRKIDHLCEIYDMKERNPHDVLILNCFHGRHHFEMRKHLNLSEMSFIDVFAVNPFSKRSRSYNGLTLPIVRSARVSRLKHGSNLNLKIDTSQRYHMLYFENKIRGALRLTYVACEGPVTIYLSKDGIVLQQIDVKRLKTQIIRDAQIGKYFISITTKFDHDVNMRVFLSSNKRRGPFPKLPRGKAVKEWPMLRTCNSVTIAWIAGNGKQQYCLFIGKDNRQHQSKPSNICSKPSYDAGITRVTCLIKRIRKRQRAVFSRTIKELLPCTNYVLYIQVKRRRSTETLLYRPLKVKTRCKKC